jgi:hypothetical protein
VIPLLLLAHLTIKGHVAAALHWRLGQPQTARQVSEGGAGEALHILKQQGYHATDVSV